MARHTLTRLTDEQRDLAGDPAHVRMAMAIADRFAARCPRERETIRSSALFGLVCAARSFRPADGVKFTSFAPRRILGAILDDARLEGAFGLGAGRGAITAGRVPRVVSHSRQMVQVDRGEKQVVNVLLSRLLDSGEMPVGWELESEDTVVVLAARLPFRRAECLRRYLLDAEYGARMRAVGESMGLSESAVSNMLAEAPQLLTGGEAKSTISARRKPAAQE